ncbi:hypothetical protein E4T42_03576 [Aureobasidium subglaciale]|nr:hypothetical protein E4T42_03576 [Aureobasidium subglaciale]
MMSLADLSIEVPCKIAELVQMDHPEDYTSMRISCKSLYQITNTPFAVTNFEERYHVSVKYGLEKLQTMTARLCFDPFVKTITIRIVERICNEGLSRWLPANSHILSADFRRLTSDASENIRI